MRAPGSRQVVSTCVQDTSIARCIFAFMASVPSEWGRDVLASWMRFSVSYLIADAETKNAARRPRGLWHVGPSFDHHGRSRNGQGCGLLHRRERQRPAAHAAFPDLVNRVKFVEVGMKLQYPHDVMQRRAGG